MARWTEGDKLRARAMLAEVVGRVVALKKQGRELVGLCPFHAEKTPSFTVSPGKGLYFCFGCSAGGDAVDFVKRTEGLDFMAAMARILGEPDDRQDEAARRRREDRLRWAAADRRDEEKREHRRRLIYAHRLWRETQAVKGTPVETYLRRRGIMINIPPTLRFHPHLAYREGNGAASAWFPAMVAYVQGADRSFLGIHRTYLRGDGAGKAPVKKARMMLGPVGGGAIRFGPAADALWIAEGIETALSVLERRPALCVWAAGSASFLGKIELPDVVREVTICADADPAGRAAAKAAAERFAGEGRKAYIARPNEEGADFNDFLMRGMEAADG